jgi:hypothetical protein
VAAGCNFDVGDQAIRLAVLARLFHVGRPNSEVPPDPTKEPEFFSDLGGVKFAGAFPVPDFLKSGSLGGEINPGGKIEIGLTVENKDQKN